MKIIVVGKTECIITLNKIGMPIHGKQQAVVEIDNDEKKNEIIGLKKAGLIDILEADIAEEPKKDPVVEIQDNSSEPNISVKEEEKEEVVTKDTPEDIDSVPKTKKNKGRPKGSKNKKASSTVLTPKTEQERIIDAEAKTQEMGSKVVISIGRGNVRSKMRRTFEGEVPETDATKESIKAMEKIEKEEAEDKKQVDTKIDESKLGPSEQMGRNAVIVHEGCQKQVEMSKSIVPGQQELRESNPFIEDIEDIEDKTKKEDPSKNAFIDENDSDDIDFLKI